MSGVSQEVSKESQTVLVEIEEDFRDRWSRKLEFLLACIGFAVGYGNFWRFPYMCFKNGGGAFLIPYLVCLALVGIPAFLMEMSIGQVMQTNAVKAWKKLCPLFGGIGYANMIISFMVSIYYNVILAWSCYYFFHSFKSELPWVGCDHEWNKNCLIYNKSNPNASGIASSKEFYNLNVLEITDGINNAGNMNWKMFGCLFLAWVLVYFCIWKGIRTTGKVVYVTATAPYIILIILFFRGVTLDGAKDGIIYFLKPNFQRLGDFKVWIDAASQIMYSLAIGFGVLLGFSSYNDKKNPTLYRDSLIISLVNCGTSVFAGLVIFAIVGYMAASQGKLVEDVASQGPGLVFIAYPEALAKLPLPQLWSVLFFLMLITLGLDSQFGQVEVIAAAIIEGYPDQLRRHKELVVLAVCTSLFLLGVSCVTQGGVYIFNVLDSFSAGVCLLFVVIFELVVIAWLHGGYAFVKTIKELTGTRIHSWWIVCWKYFSLLLVAVVFFFSLVKYPEKGITYEKYKYPVWGEVFGWLVAALPMSCIPAYAIFRIAKATGTFKERVFFLIKPEEEIISSEDLEMKKEMESSPVSV